MPEIIIYTPYKEDSNEYMNLMQSLKELSDANGYKVSKNVFSEDNGWFTIAHVCRDDILSHISYDGSPFTVSEEIRKKVEGIDTIMMRKLSDNMIEAMCETGVYWDCIDNLLDELGIEKEKKREDDES